MYIFENFNFLILKINEYNITISNGLVKNVVLNFGIILKLKVITRKVAWNERKKYSFKLKVKYVMVSSS